MRKFKPCFYIFSLLACFLLCSCASGKRVINKDTRKIPYMTKLKVETINRTVFEMKVQRTDEYGIHGVKGEYVEFAKIKRLERIPYNYRNIIIGHVVVLGTITILYIRAMIEGPNLGG